MSPTSKTRPLKPVKGDESSKAATQRKRQSSGRVSAACEACKKRKTKCSGGPAPCQLCHSLGTECIIDLTLDMRRRAALQRTLDESRTHEDTLNGLLECIVQVDESHLDSFIDFVRTNPPRRDLAATIQHHLRLIRARESNQSNFLSDDMIDSPIDGDFGPMQFVSGRSDISSPTGDSDHRSNLVSPIEQYGSGSGKAKLRHDQEQITQVLGRLKLISDTDGASMLRRLIGSGDFNVALQGQHETENLEDASSINIGQVKLENRDQWHPALQLRNNSNILDTPESFTSGSRSRSLPQTLKETIDQIHFGDETSDSEQSHQHSWSSKNSPGHIPSHVSRKVASTSYMPSINTKTAPYIERGHMTPSKNSTREASELCIAGDQPNERIRVPIHLVLPLVFADESYLSRLYTDFTRGAREMLENGVPLSDVLGSDDEMVVDLFFRERGPTDKFDCSSWACELNRSFTDMDQFVRLANAYLHTQLMKWLLRPTRENYDRLPDMIKPTPLQLAVPHIGAIDLLPLSPIRDAAISHLRDWVTPLIASNQQVNWPHGMDEALQHNPVNQSTTLTKDFIEHISNNENWSIGPEFFDKFPECRGKIRIHRPD